MKRSAPWLILLAPLAVAACSPSLIGLPSEPPPKLYDLTAPSGFSGDLPKVSWQLVVGEPSAAAGLNTDQIAVRTTPVRLQYYASSRWVEPAPRMLQSLIVTSFENTDRISVVGKEGITFNPDYRLRTNLLQFEADYPEGTDVPTVRIRIDATLVKEPGREVVASHEFTAAERPNSAAVADVIEAFDRATEGILRDLVEWTLAAPQQRTS